MLTTASHERIQLLLKYPDVGVSSDAALVASADAALLAQSVTVSVNIGNLKQQLQALQTALINANTACHSALATHAVATLSATAVLAASTAQNFLSAEAVAALQLLAAREKSVIEV